MSGSVATYTATVTVPLSLSAGTTASDFTASITATGMLQSTGTFQFNFGPRVVNWNATSGDFSGSGNWDVGFAPRTSDTGSISNGGAEHALHRLSRHAGRDLGRQRHYIDPAAR